MDSAIIDYKGLVRGQETVWTPTGGEEAECEPQLNVCQVKQSQTFRPDDWRKVES